MTPERFRELETLVSGASQDNWDAVVGVWRGLDSIYTMAAGPSGVVADGYVLVDLICERIDDYKERLAANVTHEDPRVCAYCITCLERCGRLKLTRGQETHLRSRCEELDVVSGCLASTMTLAKFAELSVKAMP